MLRYLIVFGALSLPCLGQLTTAEIRGTVQDPSGAAVADAAVGVRNLGTNAVQRVSTARDGSFLAPQLPIGAYEVTVEKAGFARYVQGPIVLRLNHTADLEVQLQLASVADTVTVVSDAPLTNAANAEVGASFDRRRISELPLAPNRNALYLALSVPGVNQIQGGQAAAGFVAIPNFPFAVSGMRVRSVGFMIDGQDSNQAIVTGLTQTINNPDIIAEFRVLTHQFQPEYGRAAGAVVHMITKSGTNQFHGSAFWFHNDHHFNAPNNIDRQPPFRLENQLGGTLGGPIVKDKTFFFGSLQRWSDRRKFDAARIVGAPTTEGRAILGSFAAGRLALQALLETLPPAEAPSGQFAPVRVGGTETRIPLGTLTGAAKVRFDDWQWSARVDHRFNDRHTVGARYLFDDPSSTGDGQAIPPGLATVTSDRTQSASLFWNSTFSGAMFHELRLSYQRAYRRAAGESPAGERIPSIQVPGLSLTGANSGPTRTALGLAGDLPRLAAQNTYQLQQTLGWLHGSHSMKFGIDFRRQDAANLLTGRLRGFLVYATLQDLVDDVAQTAEIFSPLPGGRRFVPYRSYEYHFFLQDEWRARPNLTLNYGIRYEAPGNIFDDLARANQRVLSAAGGDPRFTFNPVPARDTNNWAPRFGFNYRLPKALVVRGGYARTYDFAYIALPDNIVNTFPFVRTVRLAPRTPNSYEAIFRAVSAPIPENTNLLERSIAGADFRSPIAEQFALQLQKGLGVNWALSVGYVGTKGTALIQSVDGNPTVPGSSGRRVDPTRGLLRVLCNCASSIYHSLQASLEKRLSKDFSMAAHYTYGSFIDDASDFRTPTPTGELPVAQDAFNRRADRARSSYDRPQRFTVNGVYELPFYKAQKGTTGRLLGGWQLSGFLTLQSGAPFAALNGSDPGFRMGGLFTTVRANLNTNLDLASMSVEDILLAGGGRLFSQVTPASPLGTLGRNILRSDGIGNLDLGLLKNTRVRESDNLQLRVEFYNTFNSRDFGLPDASNIISPNFLYQWGTNGGNRRVVLGLRYTF